LSIFFIVSSLMEAGPKVQIIFVFLMAYSSVHEFTFLLTISASILPHMQK